MKVCIYGAGAVGGHLAARLARGGADVSVIARPAISEAIRANGLRVMTPDGDMHVRVAAASEARQLGAQDIVIVTAKAPALPEVAKGLAPLLGAQTAVVFAMNGIPWWYFQGRAGPMGQRRLPLIDPGDVDVERGRGAARHRRGGQYRVRGAGARRRPRHQPHQPPGAGRARRDRVGPRRPHWPACCAPAA